MDKNIIKNPRSSTHTSKLLKHKKIGHGYRINRNTNERLLIIEKAVERAVSEYRETFELLGKRKP